MAFDNPEEWQEIPCVTFATPEDAQKMADILNDMMLKIECLRKELIEVRRWQVSNQKNWPSGSLGPMG